MVSQSQSPIVASSDDPVVAAAMSLLTEVGPRRVTMAEVARRAGVSRMTVYRRFENLGQLVSAVLTAEMADVVRQAIAATPTDATARERVLAQGEATIRALVDHALLQRVLEVDPESLLPMLVERLGSGQRLLRDHVAGQLAAGMTRFGGDGSVRDGDPSLLALTVVSVAQPFVIGHRPLSAEYPTDDLVAEYRHLIDSYLSPEGGTS